ncbi:MAG: signal peptidase II [Saccharofermentanales bacterium]
MVWAIIIILCVGADQLTKAIVENSFQNVDSITVIDGFFYLVNRSNRGAAWSFLSDKEWGIYLLIAISSLASILMIILIYRSNNVKFKAAVTFICAGSIGNLIDRIFYHQVTDFIDLHFGSYVFPTFNVADSLVTCGTVFLIIVLLSDSSVLEDITRITTRKSKANVEKEEVTN